MESNCHQYASPQDRTPRLSRAMTHHLVIAGTGRAGTSFLVQYLAACGLETRLTANPHEQLDENANAGLEDVLVPGGQLPYVVKSPWLFEMVNDLVTRSDITLDAVIIPMRNLVEAATSRVILEMRARYGNDQLPPDVTHWENWAETPGGVIYSLNPVDQARILALGFHETVRALVEKDIPIIFLDFPRLINDSDYLWSKLADIIVPHASREQAMAAHTRLADASKVRTGREVNAIDQEKKNARGIEYPSHDELGRVALMRELLRLRGEAASRSAQIERLQQETAVLQTQAARATEAFRDHEEALRYQHRNELSSLQQESASRIDALERRIAQLTASTSWRLTRPLRALGDWLKPRR
ncbi:hypothetical protein UA16_02284 [Burkholderia multivorans]|nr:hypothetical protein UA16_02284 [Burkholderia multivorans]SAK09698.1 hypothetical protein UA14_02361 [Burkholderia multivorans]